jgi:peptidoglycan hydrolase-like protein with peptidoglycan-binding domain
MTRGAIRRFQRDQGVAETGDIGFALLEQIRSRTTR